MASADFTYITGLASHIKFEQLNFQSANIYGSKYHERASVMLVSKLLLHGGNFVSIPQAGLPEILALLEYGNIFHGEVNVVDAGDDMFDEDVFHQINDDPSKFKIFRGYALHTDGGWRPHTWIYDEDEEVIIDHIKRRKAYYGVETNPLGSDSDDDDEYEPSGGDSIINDDDENALYGDAWSPKIYTHETSGGRRRS